MEKRFIKYLCASYIILQALVLSACGNSGSSGNANANNSAPSNNTPGDNNPPSPPPPVTNSSPTVLVTPADNTGNVAYVPNIKLHFSESVNHVNIYTVTLHVNSESGDSVPLKLIGSESNIIYLFKPESALVNNAKYVVAMSHDITAVATKESLADTTSSFMTMSNHYAYITNNKESTVTVCLQDSINGELSQCKDTGSGLSYAYGVVVDPEFKHAYIANQAGTISICDINSVDGTLSNCNGYQDKNIPLASGLAIDPQGNNLYIGIMQEGSKLTKCSINKNDGSLSNCMYLSFQPNDMGSYSANDISISKDGKIAYITAYYQTVISCPINIDGTFASNGCQRYNSSEYFPNPMAIAVNPLIESGVYVINGEHPDITTCKLGGGSWSCGFTGQSFSAPGGIALDLYNRYAYVTNNGGNSVSFCLITTDSSLGSLDGCVSISGGGKFNSPNMITIY